MSRPLVITTAFAYGPDDLWPLLDSLQQSAPAADVLVLTAEEDLPTLAALQQSFPRLTLEAVAGPPRVIHGRWALPRKLASRSRRWLRQRWQKLQPQPAIAIEQRSRWGLSTTQAHFLIRRFFWARERLSQARWRDHDPVMLCDVRDVVVQGNPFAGVGDALVTGEEFGLFDHCPINRRWIRRAYGPAAEQELFGRPALCAGVVIGSRQQTELYLELFCQEALALMRRHGTSCLANLDQAIHNRILRRSPPVRLHLSAVNGPIATVGCVPAEEIQVPSGPGPVRVMGAVPLVLHQYDRRPALVAHVRERHGQRSGGQR